MKIRENKKDRIPTNSVHLNLIKDNKIATIVNIKAKIPHVECNALIEIDQSLDLAEYQGRKTDINMRIEIIKPRICILKSNL
jgi:hypothetical protein